MCVCVCVCENNNNCAGAEKVFFFFTGLYIISGVCKKDIPETDGQGLEKGIL